MFAIATSWLINGLKRLSATAFTARFHYGCVFANTLVFDWPFSSSIVAIKSASAYRIRGLQWTSNENPRHRRSTLSHKPIVRPARLRRRLAITQSVATPPPLFVEQLINNWTSGNYPVELPREPNAAHCDNTQVYRNSRHIFNRQKFYGGHAPKQ